MNRSTNQTNHVTVITFWLTTLLAIPFATWAEDFSKAERLYADHCAVCHGADRGGYIGPALNSDQTKLTEKQISTKIHIGGDSYRRGHKPDADASYVVRKIIDQGNGTAGFAYRQAPETAYVLGIERYKRFT